MNSKPTSLEALQTAVAKLGGQSATSRLCGVSQGAVWRWISVAHQLPAEMVLRIEAATHVSRHDLRPDIYPFDLPPARSSWNARDQGTDQALHVKIRCSACDNNASPSTNAAAPSTKSARPAGR